VDNILSIGSHSSGADSQLAARAMEDLMAALAPIPLDHTSRDRLRVRVMACARVAAQPEGTRTLRADEGAWLDFAPGVSIKLLKTDAERDRMTALIRMQPGSALPRHHHEQTEECLILEGALFIGSHRLGAGDMHVAPTGTEHAQVSSPSGALMLVHARLCNVRG
jgi:anti-sigma factor ChrR (cupin superfamily)